MEGDAMGVRFDQKLVKHVAKRSEEITGGAFKLAYTGASGGRYVDAMEQLSWHGEFASRSAVAYYAAGAVEWQQRMGDAPDAELSGLVFNLSRQARYREWADKGRTRAALTWGKGR